MGCGTLGAGLLSLEFHRIQILDGTCVGRDGGEVEHIASRSFKLHEPTCRLSAYLKVHRTSLHPGQVLRIICDRR